jgi:nucleotide-binding universal stress UspA family protein
MKMIVGYEGGGAEDKVIQLAKQQAKANSASVEIMHVVDPTPKNESDLAKQEAAEKEVRAIAAGFEADNISCQVTIARGLAPGDLILDAARDGDADMIVIGVKKKSRLGKFVFGSTAQLIILDAPCPVLTV